MAESFNDSVQDAMILAQIRALREGATLSRDVREQLSALEKDLLSVLATVDPAGPIRLRTRQARVAEALKAMQPLIHEAYSALSRETARTITTRVLKGVETLAETINTTAGLPLLTPAVTTETISILVTTTPFPSVPSPTLPSTTAPEWWRRQMVKMGQRVEDTLSAGARAEDTLSQLVTRLRGTARQGFTDGVMAIVKKDAESLALTASSLGHNQGRVALWDANGSVVKGIVHLSTLDSRTCLGRGSLVRTPRGAQAIEMLRAGDMVYGRSGEQRAVLATHQATTQRIAWIRFTDESSVICTPDHRFLTKEGDWIKAQALRHGSPLPVAIRSVDVMDLQHPIAVYDLSVDKEESFLLANGVVAHNSTICIARSGKQYTVPEHEPIGHTLPYLSGIPYHFYCRSTFNPIFPTFEELLGAKGRRFDQQLDALPEGTRASMDGKIPASTTFDAWLKTQPASVQLHLLGKTRRALWQEGKLTLSQLLEQATGRVLRIEEL